MEPTDSKLEAASPRYFLVFQAPDRDELLIDFRPLEGFHLIGRVERFQWDGSVFVEFYCTGDYLAPVRTTSITEWRKIPEGEIAESSIMCTRCLNRLASERKRGFTGFLEWQLGLGEIDLTVEDMDSQIGPYELKSSL